MASRASSPGTQPGRIRLHQDDGELLPDLPAAAAATVPAAPRALVGLTFTERPSRQP